MEKIEKIENIVSSDNVEKTLMTISDGNKVTQAEIYLAYIDGETAKRYVVYTNDLNRKENEKGTFNLAVMRFDQNGYILEGTDNDTHKNIEVKTLNVIGLSNGKTLDEVKADLQRELPNISIIDLAALKNNVDNMTISNEKPPRKANMPMAIANVIKKYYLFELNRELKKIYSSPRMSEEQIDASYAKLDKIDSKLDELIDTYDRYPNNDKYNPTVNKSFEEITNARNDIIDAQRNLEFKSMQNLEEEHQNFDEEVDIPLDPPTFNDDENEEMETQNSNEEKLEETETPVSNEEKLEETETPVSNEEKIEPAVTNNFSENDVSSIQDDIDDKKQNIINGSVNKFSFTVESIVNELTVGISSIYEKKLKEKEEENNNLKDQIKASEEEKGELSKMLEGVKNTAQLAAEKAKSSKESIDNLTLKNGELEKENIELKSKVDSQKQLLDQQNSNMEALREEGKSRENSLLQDMESLKNEINRLKQYENAYNQIVGMVNGQKNPEEPTNNVTK